MGVTSPAIPEKGSRETVRRQRIKLRKIILFHEQGMEGRAISRRWGMSGRLRTWFFGGNVGSYDLVGKGAKSENGRKE